MSSMEISISFDDDALLSKDLKPFVLFRDFIRPALEQRRGDLDAMYHATLGRPEIDPVFLTGVTLLQIMERLPDRQAITACKYDARWRLALAIPKDWPGIDPSTLAYFRCRLEKHDLAEVALQAGLEAMRNAGYLRRHGAVRIDSTHILGHVADMSRLECVRETLRLALEFLVSFGGKSAWEPWFTRYAERNPRAVRDASTAHLRSTMQQAGRDARDILAKAADLGAAVLQVDAVALLKRVFDEQFEIIEGGVLQERRATPPGAVHNPHDPEAEWSSKDTARKTAWVGYKLQLCETAPEQAGQPTEPTKAVITAVVTQPATTSDHGSVPPVLAAHEQGGQEKPNEAQTDAGYISGPALHEAKIQHYILTGPVAPAPRPDGRFGSDSFTVDIPNRVALCPAGQRSTECSRITQKDTGKTSYYFAWPTDVCAACPLKDQCVSKEKTIPARSLEVGEHHMLVQERRLECKDPEYQQRMHRRSGIEGTHSELTRRYGIRRSRYRGRRKTNLQMQFTAAACNLRRWAARECWLRTRNQS
jgi:transposase